MFQPTHRSSIRILPVQFFHSKGFIEHLLPWLDILNGVRPAKVMKGDDSLDIGTGQAVRFSFFRWLVTGARVPENSIKIQAKLSNRNRGVLKNGDLVQMEIGKMQMYLVGFPVSNGKGIKDRFIELGPTIGVD